MDSILVIILFAILAVLSDKLGGKKKVPPRPRRRDIDSQLPPPVPQPWSGQRRDIPAPRSKPTDASRPVDPQMAHVPVSRPRPMATPRPVSPVSSVSVERPVQPVQQPSRPILPPLTLGTAQQAVVMVEILGRPRAYRQFPRR